MKLLLDETAEIEVYQIDDSCLKVQTPKAENGNRPSSTLLRIVVLFVTSGVHWPVYIPAHTKFLIFNYC